MGKVATFRSLTVAEKLAAFEAAACLLLCRMLVALVPPRYWRKSIDRGLAEPFSQPSQSEDQVRLVRQAIGRVTRNIPVEIVCLPQALAARWMLARRGVATVLNIGAQRMTGQAEASDQPRLHAWLMAGEMWVTGDCNPQDFALLRPDAVA